MEITRTKVEAANKARPRGAAFRCTLTLKPTRKVVLNTARDVSRHVHDMHDLPKECLRGLYVDGHHRLIHDEVLSIGTLDANLFHPREVFQPAVLCAASAVILVHNHPSGVVTPSEADITATKQMVEAGCVMGITLLDHVIVGRGKFASIPVEYDHAG